MNHSSFGAAAAALLLAACAPSAPSIAVTDAWARATAPGQTSAAVYATISSKGGDDRLVDVSSSAGQAMLHGNDMRGEVARMRMITDLAIPAGASVALAPGGTHVMISGLARPLTAGSDFALTLRFAKAGARTVKVAVVAPGAR